MHRILITAFEPFLQYPTNASQQILSHWLEDHPGSDRSTFVTEILPVEYVRTEPRLLELHNQSFDFALHLGQAPRIDRFNLEMIALNVKSDPTIDISPLNPEGPAAYASALPLQQWSGDLTEREIPATVSFHAGTYLCNATYFWSTEAQLRRGKTDRSLFVHVPLIDMESENPDEAIRLGSKMLTRLTRLIEDHLDAA
ncbi:pyroglutamyl-peptidase I [Bremerella cremea]|uniref:pyroglutamyl-peptidase I family protein n=1 Tax=Bremerella cremea TaxID=1031537 RepID=UPI0031E8537B